jgi:hypothetical protein
MKMRPNKQGNAALELMSEETDGQRVFNCFGQRRDDMGAARCW